jgi:hypothetical protein
VNRIVCLLREWIIGPSDNGDCRYPARWLE